MSKKLNIPYQVKSKHLTRERCNWVVYQKEYGKVKPTYYITKKEVILWKDHVLC